MRWILFFSFVLFGHQGIAIQQTASFTQLQEIAFNKQRNYEDRWKALMEIVEKYPDGAESTLSLAAQEPEWFMKNAALVGLEKINSPQRFKIAQSLLVDKALVVRSQAVQVLTQHRDPETRKMLWTELEHPRNFKKKQSLWIRHQIVEHLALKPLKSERSKFIRLFEDPDKKVKEASRLGLRKIQM